MSELDIINNTSKPNTIESMHQDLVSLGVNEGDILLVHSSLSRIGWVCGNEIAVIRSLMASVGSIGTLVMPAHSGENSDPAKWENPPVPEGWWEEIRRSMPPFDCAITPTRGMGRIADRFRTFPGTKRSDHPHVSFCARGRHSDEIISSHTLTPQFGMDTPLGKLYQMNARILLLGVGYGNCTSFHLSEYLAGGMPVSTMGAAIGTIDARKWQWFDDIVYNSDDFEQIGVDYESKADGVSFGNIGNARCRLFEMKPAVDFATQWIQTNRNR